MPIGKKPKIVVEVEILNGKPNEECSFVEGLHKISIKTITVDGIKEVEIFEIKVNGGVMKFS